ncbi:MAG: CAAX prenyl protease-related protein [Kiritimatiellaeota bacterium]|nr:CAAX prenyl protease-related protein [Kiritimatiellota bacterium]
MSEEKQNPVSSDGISEYAPKGSPKAKLMTFAAVCHALPFLLWIGVMLLADMMHLLPSDEVSESGEAVAHIISNAGMYAVRTVLCVVAVCVLRPWRWYPALQKKNVLPAVIMGLVIFLLWVGFETQFIKNLAPGLAELYEKYCVFPFGKLRDLTEFTDKPPPYAPSVCGWPLALTRLLGSAFVIAVIEEFFWRGYLLRTAKTPDFLDLDIGYYNPKIFLIVALIFGFQHTEFAAGIITGLVYGYFYLITRDIWAVAIAHITTNLALGVYVLCTGYWWFW